MGILDKLKPQPRWKHADAAVRLEAVRDLDDQLELKLLAEGDPDVRVRRAVIGRLTDTASIGAVANRDADAETRDLAADRLVVLATRPADAGLDETAALHAAAALQDPRRLSTVAKSDATEAVRAAALNRLTDPRAIASVARSAKQESTAAAALVRVLDPDELLDIALNASHKDVALAAFERLAATADLSQLRTIDVRAQHKPVSRRARTMIQEQERAEAARHAAALERQRRESMLCEAAEQLKEIADVAVARAEVARLAAAWSDLAVTEQGALARFAAALEEAEAAIIRREREAEEALDRQRVRAEAIATRVALCERVETVDGDDAIEQLQSLEEEWRSLLPLIGNGPEADKVSDRFTQAVAACRKRHAMGAELVERRTRLEGLATEAESLAALEDRSAAFARWESLHREARRLSQSLAEASRPADDLAPRFEAVAQVFDARVQEHRAAEAQARQELLVLIQRLHERAKRVAEAETMTLREGERLMRDLTAALETATQAGASPDLDRAAGELRALQERIAPRVRELREMDDWRRFANAQRQEQLIGMAEAIVLSLKAEEEAGSPTDFAATAKALRELHASWQEVAEAPRQTAQRLWDRFRAATDLIRSRCEPYFIELRQKREQGVQRKQEIVAAAEALAESTDWVATAATLQELQNEWLALTRGGRDAERELTQRFRAACNTFFTRRRDDLSDRKKVWTDNLTRKEALCERAEALSQSSDWDTASAAMKQLQAEWKTIGPVRKNKSEAVWNRFRAAADRFFERYHSRHEIEMTTKLLEREAVVVELERIAGLSAEEVPADLGTQVQNMRTEWHRNLPAGAPGMKPILDRWQAALMTILATHPAAFAGTDLDPATVVQRMEKLVARMESLAATIGHQQPESRLSPTEQLAARLRQAFATNAMGGRPTDESKWRDALETVRDAQSAWHRLPAIGLPEVEALGIRFRDACRRVTEQARRHVQPTGSGQKPRSSRPETTHA